MIKWDEDLKKSPQGEAFLLRVNDGVFGGGWQFHKALRVRDKFFQYETKDVIANPHSWSKVNL